MKSFTQYLTEKTSWDDALKVFGLSASYTQDDLDSKRKAFTRQYHPDRNPGNKSAADMMAKVNDAYDVLKARLGKGGTRTTFNRQDYEDMDAKRKAYAQVARDAADKHLNLEPFVKHFTDVFGEQFFVTKRDWNTRDATVASYEAEFANKARTIVADFSLYIDYTALYQQRTLNSADAGLTMSILSDILVNRKKVKLTQQNYRMENEYKVLNDPEVLFPRAKLKAQSEKSVSRKMSKRDVLLTFEKELGATIEHSGPQIWVYVPVGAFTVSMWRTTMMGQAMWDFNGIYEKRKRIIMLHGFFAEDEAGITLVMNALRDLQRNPPSSTAMLGAEIEGVIRAYKATRS